jgi:hypothetical protein
MLFCAIVTANRGNHFMSELVTNCPRCNSNKITFDVRDALPTTIEHGWLQRFEAFSVCRNCHRSTVFILAQKEYAEADFIKKNGPIAFGDSLNNHFNIVGFVNLTDRARVPAPEFTIEEVARAFDEAAACMGAGAWNGAAAMLRLSIDLATKTLLPKEFTLGLNRRTRRDLAPRLDWLLAHGKLPEELRELSQCIQEDGNDGAHDGTLKKEDAEDLMDFAIAMFERLYTEPERLQLAKARREKRRADGKKA